MEESKLFDTGISDILAKKAEKLKERKERADKGEPNKLLVERTETGLYFLRYKGGGTLPDVLKGNYTRKAQLLDLVRSHYGTTDMVE